MINDIFGSRGGGAEESGGNTLLYLHFIIVKACHPGCQTGLHRRLSDDETGLAEIDSALSQLRFEHYLPSDS